MPLTIEITADEHQKAIETPEGMEALLTKILALHEQEFWGRSQATVAVMAKELLPLIKAMEIHLDGHPELKSLDFAGACFYCFNRMHNRPLAEVIAEAERIVKKDEVADEPAA